MNEFNNALQTIRENGSMSYGQAAIYAGGAICVAALFSAILRSGLLVILGIVSGFYLFSLNTPDSTLAYTAAASDRLIEQVKAVGGCATRHIEDAQTLGIIIKNGDVIEIAKQCGIIK